MAEDSNYIFYAEIPAVTADISAFYLCSGFSFLVTCKHCSANGGDIARKPIGEWGILIVKAKSDFKDLSMLTGKGFPFCPAITDGYTSMIFLGPY